MPSRAYSGRISAKLIFSYVFDWVIVILAAAAGALFSIITPNKRPFSLTNPEISFPYVTKEKISTTTLILCGLAAPAVIILLVSLIFVPGPTVPKSVPKSLIWRRKLWEWHQGWLGLGLSLASAFLITGGMKNLFGKPRPDILSRCNPDLANVSKYALGEVGNLVTAAICRNTNKSMMNDGFRSFPSGHSSFSSAGLIYLSLFLASKLAITIPFLSPSTYSSDPTRVSAFPSRAERNQSANASTVGKTSPTLAGEPYSRPSGHDDALIAVRSQAASPPVYLLVLAIIPWFASIYISSTRFSDFRHHGFDILFGYFIGTVCAFFAFRFYHLPISRGAGWAWGPRSRERSFWSGVGVGRYAGSKRADSDAYSPRNSPAIDVEAAPRGVGMAH